MDFVDVYEIRRLALARQLLTSGLSMSAFAKATGVSPIYLTQVLSAKTQRRMGDKVARRIENKRDLPPGWMDQVDEATTTLTDEARELAHKFQQLPQNVRERIAHEIDTLHRYSVD